QPTRTTPHLVAFRDWLIHRMAEETGRTFINATGAGILHGTPVVQGSLNDVTGVAGARRRLVGGLTRMADDAARSRRAAAPRLASSLARLPAETRGVWSEFGRGTMTPDQLDLAVRRIRDVLDGLAPERRPEAARTSPMLPAADRAAR